jgi:hypothetical protein
MPADSWLAIYAVLPPGPGEPEPTFLGLLELEDDVMTSKAVSLPMSSDGASFLAVSLRIVLESPPNTPAAPAVKIGIIRDQDPVATSGQRVVNRTAELAPDPSMRVETFVALAVDGGGA